MSPEVWDDALARAQAACAALQLPLEQPNTQQQDHEGDPLWVLIEGQARLSDRIELDGLVWQEDGQIWLHVMAATGSGARPALVARKALAAAFRTASGLPDGLTYLGHDFGPADAGDEAGNWTRFSLAIDYRFQDIAQQGERL
jgi:hypothetical protein